MKVRIGTLRSVDVLLLVLLLCILFTSRAMASEWAFSFAPLCDSSTCVTLDGTFAGTDSNSDGIIDRQELQRLRAGGTEYFPGRVTEVPGQPDLTTSWGTNRFHYVIGGALDFETVEAGYHYIITIDVGRAWTFGNIGGTYAWTPDTVQSVILLAVPEPATWMLLGAGGAALLVTRRIKHGVRRLEQ